MDHKRLLQGNVIILLLAATVTVAACGGGASTALSPTATPTPTHTTTPTDTPAPTHTTTPTDTTAPAPTATPVLPSPTGEQGAPASIDGDWQGTTFYRQGGQTTMIHFESSQEGIQGTADFPQMGRFGFALSKVSFEPPKVHFELRELSTVYDGELNGDKIKGEFVAPDGSGPFSLRLRRP